MSQASLINSTCHSIHFPWLLSVYWALEAGVQGQVIGSPQGPHRVKHAIHSYSYKQDVLNKPNMQTLYGGIPSDGIKQSSITFCHSAPVHWLVNEQMSRLVLFFSSVLSCLVVTQPAIMSHITLGNIQHLFFHDKPLLWHCWDIVFAMNSAYLIFVLL